jgi:ribulose-5-phosphate 4-epimerase/fuculose-1-phosphate aldolase
MQPWLGGSVEVAPYAALGTVEVAQNSANTIGTKGACLMANHGVVAVANSLDLAYVRACYVEDAAKIIHLARCIGTPCEIAMR